MINKTRHVDIRGYIREVVVLEKLSSSEWYVQDGKKYKVVPEHLFYHRAPDGLVLRDSVEFKRKYPHIKVEEENIPS